MTEERQVGRNLEIQFDIQPTDMAGMRGAKPCSLINFWASVSTTAAIMRRGAASDRAYGRRSRRCRCRVPNDCEQTKCPQQGPFSCAECGLPGIAKNGNRIVSMRDGQPDVVEKLSTDAAVCLCNPSVALTLADYI